MQNKYQQAKKNAKNLEIYASELERNFKDKFKKISKMATENEELNNAKAICDFAEKYDIEDQPNSYVKRGMEALRGEGQYLKRKSKELHDTYNAFSAEIENDLETVGGKAINIKDWAGRGRKTADELEEDYKDTLPILKKVGENIIEEYPVVIEKIINDTINRVSGFTGVRGVFELKKSIDKQEPTIFKGQRKSKAWTEPLGSSISATSTTSSSGSQVGASSSATSTTSSSGSQVNMINNKNNGVSKSTIDAWKAETMDLIDSDSITFRGASKGDLKGLVENYDTPKQFENLFKKAYKNNFDAEYLYDEIQDEIEKTKGDASGGSGGSSGKGSSGTGGPNQTQDMHPPGATGKTNAELNAEIAKNKNTFEKSLAQLQKEADELAQQKTNNKQNQTKWKLKNP